ncbi:hypothetical protein QWY28_07980 [Nocardioides sp. SOB77]|uniref:ABC transporter substrate-binding protein n=1 Tax=Nocardioides oceani TaxID=3058369 RepID=A0ABT8FDW3_9ACTN|nr:hypothetical protein [Nocardioides oceani]MDN4172873.1 hypothetical protein [Nocardioides oceani]
MDLRLRTVLPAVAVAASLVGAAAATAPGAGDAPRREGQTLEQDWQARTAGQQVLGGERTPGVPSVQRIRHDDVVFTVTVAPARPGPNLVRVDSRTADGGAHDHRAEPVRVGTAGLPDRDFVRARPRPGTDGLWAVVDLPPGTATVLLTHGRWHRVPFLLETGDAGTPAAPVWRGSDGPECLGAATGTTLAGDVPDGCPTDALADGDAEALTGVVDLLADRGVEELALRHDRSARSREARALVARAAARRGVRLVGAGDTPGRRNALLVLSGWADAARSLAAVSRTPLRRQPIRSDGTWLAPWLLTPGVVDTTAGAMVPLDFDIRSEAARAYSGALARYLPGQAPTATGYAAWRSALGEPPATPTLHAATRAAYLPAEPGHAAHGTEIAWFPGGTVTPVGPLPR